NTVDAAQFEHVLRECDLPVLAEFFVSGCPSCKRFAPFLEEIAAHFAGQVRILRVNVDEEPVLANRHRIRLVPSLLFLRASQEVDRLEGVASPYSLEVKL